MVVSPSAGSSGGTGSELWVVVVVLKMDYCVPFSSPPPLSSVPVPLPSYSPASIKGIALQGEILTLIAKGVVELTPLSPGFYSRLFVVQKTLGAWRPVIDLSHLNEFVRQTHFKMKSNQSVLRCVQKSDWMVSIDSRTLTFRCRSIPIVASFFASW